jgi:hypothetical protein
LRQNDFVEENFRLEIEQNGYIEPRPMQVTGQSQTNAHAVAPQRPTSQTSESQNNRSSRDITAPAKANLLQ